MQPTELREYMDGMTRIKAQERLELMDAIQYPHIGSKDRTKSHRAVSKLANPQDFESRILKTTELELI